jgi:hypothetical protein
MGVFKKIFAGLAPNTVKADQLVIDATHNRRGERLLTKKCPLPGEKAG